MHRRVGERWASTVGELLQKYGHALCYTRGKRGADFGDRHRRLSGRINDSPTHATKGHFTH
jgi:hypothetical protein